MTDGCPAFASALDAGLGSSRFRLTSAPSCVVEAPCTYAEERDQNPETDSRSTSET